MSCNNSLKFMTGLSRMFSQNCQKIIMEWFDEYAFNMTLDVLQVTSTDDTWCGGCIVKTSGLWFWGQQFEFRWWCYFLPSYYYFFQWWFSFSLYASHVNKLKDYYFMYYYCQFGIISPHSHTSMNMTYFIIIMFSWLLHVYSIAAICTVQSTCSWSCMKNRRCAYVDSNEAYARWSLCDHTCICIP